MLQLRLYLLWPHSSTGFYNIFFPRYFYYRLSSGRICPSTGNSFFFIAAFLWMRATEEKSQVTMRPLEASGRKWSAEEDLQLLELRARKVTWEQISKKFHSRSALSCRLHYQNYLTKIDWDEDKLNELAKCYEKYAESACRQKKRLMCIDISLVCGQGSPENCVCHGTPSRKCIGN